MNKNQCFHSRLRRAGCRVRANGFALVATVAILVLLGVLMLGLLSLSSVSLRSGAMEKHRMAAQANARLALMMALNSLQMELGDDRRASVPATQWAQPRHPGLMAAYNGRTMAEELTQSLDGAYYERRNGFRKWLVSHADLSAIRQDTFMTSGSFARPVILKNFPADASRNLVADKIPCGNGGYAWAVQDESTKARIDLRQETRQPAMNDVASAMMTSGLAGDFGPQILPDFATLDPSDAKLKKLISQQTFGFLATSALPLPELMEHMTPYSLGLMTDAKQGGLRKDLNLLLELREDELPAEYVDIQPWTSSWGGSRALNNRKFSDLPGVNATRLDTLPVALLQGYYQLYRMGKQPSSDRNDGSRTVLQNGRPTQTILGLPSASSTTDRYWRGYGHSLRTTPIVARSRDIVWAGASEISGQPGQYQLYYITFPVVTLWNPYNVETVVDQFWIQYQPHPGEVMAEGNMAGSPFYNSLGGNCTMRFGTGGGGHPPVRLQPGETKVFFPDFANSNYTNSNMIDRWPVNLDALAPFRTATSGFKGSATTNVAVTLMPRRTGNQYSVTHYNDGWTNNNKGIYQGTKIHAWGFNFTKVWQFFKGGEKSLETTLGQLSERPRPIGIVDIGLKAASDTNQPGLLWAYDYPLRMNVATHYNAMPLMTRDPSEAQFLGSRQASPLQYSYTPLRGDTDLSRYLSTLEDADGVHDYMGFSHEVTQGSSYLTMCELPFVPLHSLGQLQHLPLQDEQWRHDSRAPFTPTWTFTIGNSMAHPWLQPNQLAEPRVMTMYDHWSTANDVTRDAIDRLWVANALLFDSHFFSTLAPQNNSWFETMGTSRTLQKVFDQAWDEEVALPNSRYRFSRGVTRDVARAALLDGSGMPTRDAYAKIARFLQVHGNFNINSTSEQAWEVMLAGVFKKSMPVQPAASGAPMTRNASTKFVVSRFTHPNGVSLDQSGADPYAQGFNGYRELEKEQIEQLARAIVVEVKSRGPFRSVAEFVNRRRMDDAASPLCRYGAVQAALESDTVTINAAYKGARFTAADFPNAPFTNPAAAQGSRAHGMPGCVNQADILTPLAPVMTCRGDTFVVRCYGESLHPDGRVAARAYGEAVIQRTVDFIDQRDAPETAMASLVSPVNRTFGRRFRVAQFRWLEPLQLR